MCVQRVIFFPSLPHAQGGRGVEVVKGAHSHFKDVGGIKKGRIDGAEPDPGRILSAVHADVTERDEKLH